MKQYFNRIKESPKALLPGFLVVVIFIFVVFFVFLSIAQKHVTGVALLTLSENTAVVGGHVRDGIEKGVYRIRENASFDTKIKMHYVDVNDYPGGAEEAFDDAVKQYQPDFMITMLSSVANQLKSKADQAQIPLFATVTADPGVTEGTNWTYRYWSTAPQYVAILEQHLKRENIQSLNMVYLNDAYGNAMRREVEKSFQNSDIIITYTPYNFDDDILSILNSLKDSEAIYLVGFEEQVIDPVNIFFDTQQFSGVFLTSASLYNPVALKKLSSNVRIFEAAPILFFEQYEVDRLIRSNFETLFGYEMGTDSAVAYDIVLFLGTVVNSLPKVNSLTIQEKLKENLTYSGVFGLISLEDNSNDFLYDLYPVEIQRDSIRYLFE